MKQHPGPRGKVAVPNGAGAECRPSSREWVLTVRAAWHPVPGAGGDRDLATAPSRHLGLAEGAPVPGPFTACYATGADPARQAYSLNSVCP